jgi:hypothetical protein
LFTFVSSLFPNPFVIFSLAPQVLEIILNESYRNTLKKDLKIKFKSLQNCAEKIDSIPFMFLKITLLSTAESEVIFYFSNANTLPNK